MTTIILFLQLISYTPEPQQTTEQRLNHLETLLPGLDLRDGVMVLFKQSKKEVTPNETPIKNNEL